MEPIHQIMEEINITQIEVIHQIIEEINIIQTETINLIIEEINIIVQIIIVKMSTTIEIIDHHNNVISIDMTVFHKEDSFDQFDPMKFGQEPVQINNNVEVVQIDPVVDQIIVQEVK